MPAANKVPSRDAGEKQLAYIRAIQTANAIMRSRTQPDSNGLYPDEIGFLILLDSGINYAGPLYYDNCLGKLLIPSISKIREDLRSKGMLTLGTPQDGLYYTNYYELRRFYKEYELGQPPKKKAALIKELQVKVPNDILKKRFPPRDTYCLTPKAHEEVENHECYSAAGIRNRCYLFVHNSQGEIISCIRGSLVGFLLNMYDHIRPY